MFLVLLLICAGWYNAPGNGEVVTFFEDTCPQFFFRGTPPNGGLNPSHFARICQRYKNLYRFATLYDKDHRIPVYSAYIYNPGQAKRPNKWMVEPQLAGLASQPEMETEGAFLQESGAKEDALQNSQAILLDYKNLTDFNRGHLNPNGHQPDVDAKASTFTLTNIVPQYIKLNGGAWNNYEQSTMARMTEECEETFAVVGAVPGNNYIAKGRVNKPSYVWSAACCVIDNNHLKSWAIISQNDENVVHTLTLGELEEKLTELYKGNPVSLFDPECPRA
ncbi:endonuclease domain-containing 1 protein-like [Hemicordylus capensis]|uniref:endonuclease domain-containing 1 protein-like n=1 Tax=Hemicordylus capensis TaxID=884348 RepID=UPI0023045144|nr:endonuclease domain-containing 1 protein-like [Hemicordylus capensis]